MTRRPIPRLTDSQLLDIITAAGEPNQVPFPDEVRSRLEETIAALCAKHGAPPLPVVRSVDDCAVFLLGWGDHTVVLVGSAIAGYPAKPLEAVLTHEVRHHVHDDNYATFRGAARVERLEAATLAAADRGDIMWARARWAARERGAGATLAAMGYRARATLTSASAAALVAGTVATSLHHQSRSRRRELLADREAAQSMGDTEPMAAALLRFHAENPTPQDASLLGRVTSTHPTLNARMRNLARAHRTPLHRTIVQNAAAGLTALGASRRLPERGDRSLG